MLKLRFGLRCGQGISDDFFLTHITNRREQTTLLLSSGSDSMKHYKHFYLLQALGAKHELKVLIVHR
jgi:hypothetical protein